MKSQETEQLLAHLNFLYPNQLSKKTPAERSGMIESWTMFFRDFPFIVVMTAAQKTAMESPDYCPSAPKIYAKLEWATSVLIRKNDPDCLAWLERRNLAIEQQKRAEEREIHAKKSHIRLSKIRSAIENHADAWLCELLQEFYDAQQSIENLDNERDCYEHFEHGRRVLMDEILNRADDEVRQEIDARVRQATKKNPFYRDSGEHEKRRQTALYFDLIDLWEFEPMLHKWEMSQRYEARSREGKMLSAISFQMPALREI